VAAETLVTTGLVLVAGEITTECYVDIPRVARETVKSIGYTRAKYGFDGDTCAVITAIDEQSADIALGVDQALEVKTGGGPGEAFARTGAGDQGMVFGFACTDTPEYMPLPISLAHRLARRLAEVRKTRQLPYLRPDGKSQVTVEYWGDRPVRVDTVILSAQHRDDISQEQLRHDLMGTGHPGGDPGGAPGCPDEVLCKPNRAFRGGGPHGDTGLTGRKIIVDTYGGFPAMAAGLFREGPHQGGPLRCLCRPVCSQEYCGGGTGLQV
jgi:S-adenosylmethionine synthetase